MLFSAFYAFMYLRNLIVNKKNKFKTYLMTSFILLLPKFPAALSFLNLLEAPSLFGEYFIFFPMILKTEHLITSVNSNASSREPLICLNGITVNLTEERDRGSTSNGISLVYARCYSSLSTNHVGMPHQALI